MSISREKGSFHPNDFLSRAERVAKMKIPNTSQRTLIVKPNNEGIGFRFNCYAPEFLPPTINKTTFDKTVKECHKICEGAYLQKKNEEQTDFGTPYKRTLIFGSFLLFIAIVLLIIRVYGTDNDADLWIAAIVLISATMVVTILIVVRTFFATPKFINVEEVTKQRLQAYLEQENIQFYRRNGFEWIMEPAYYWLELHRIGGDPTELVAFKRQHTDTDNLLKTTGRMNTDSDNTLIRTARLNTENDPAYASPAEE